MNIYKISQSENVGYDTYDSAIVIAPNIDIAKGMHPNGDVKLSDKDDIEDANYDWATSKAKVNVEYLGVADKKFKNKCVICASFNAG